MAQCWWGALCYADPEQLNGQRRLAGNDCEETDEPSRSTIFPMKYEVAHRASDQDRPVYLYYCLDH